MRLISQYEITSVQLSDLMASKFFHMILPSLCAGFLFLPVQGQAQLPDQAEPRLDENSGGFSASSPHPRRSTFYPLILDRGISVEDQPNDLWQLEWYAPEIALDCHPDTWNNPCARVLWDMERPAEPGDRYIARVPGLVRLHGLKRDVWWVPFVQCMSYDPERGQMELDAPGLSCQSVPDSYIQRMEWYVGGRIEGLDMEVPGIYEGSLPLLITSGDRQWELLIPVRYDLRREIPSCVTVSFNTTSISFNGLPEKIGGTAKMHVERLGPLQVPVSRLELLGGYADPDKGNCGVDGTNCGASGSLARFSLDGYTPGTSVQIDISATQIAGPPPDRPRFTSYIGHYTATTDWQLIKSDRRGYRIDQDDIYWNPDGEAYLVLGGEVTIPATWAAGTYTGNMTVEITCGP